MLSFMKDFNFELLINKNIEDVSNYLNCKFKNNLSNSNFFYSNFEKEKKFRF